MRKSDFFKIAKEKLESPYEYPQHKKQILVASGNYRLLTRLNCIAEQEKAQLRHARPDTPDIFVFSASVRVIDRHYLGREAWEDFCDFLYEVNSCELHEEELDEWEESGYDDTPIVVVDSDAENLQTEFSYPHSALGSVYYFKPASLELIANEVCRLLRKSRYFVAPIKAEKEWLSLS